MGLYCLEDPVKPEAMHTFIISPLSPPHSKLFKHLLSIFFNCIIGLKELA